MGTTLSRWLDLDLLEERTVDWGLYLYVLPAVGLYLLFMAYPLARAFLMSFQQFPSIGQPGEWVGLANYVAVVNDPVFWIAMKNTVFFALGMILVPLMAALVLGAVLDSMTRGDGTLGSKGNSVVRALLFTPLLVAPVVFGVVFRWMFATKYGLINTVLVDAGLLESGISWFGEALPAFAAVNIATAWSRTGYYLVILLAGLQAIPDHVYEAATIQGKSRWAKFRHITIPLLKPSIVIVLIIGIIDTFRLFAEVYVMTGGGPARATETLGTYFYATMFGQFNFGKGAAIAFVILLFALGVSFVVDRWLG